MAAQREERNSVVCNGDTLKQIICFFFLGFQTLNVCKIALTAAPDILSGSPLSTSTVAVAMNLPFLMVKLIFPWFVHISYPKRLVIVILLNLAGLILIVTSSDAHWRLVGIFVLGLESSLAEITFFALTAQYEKVTVSAFVAGEGFGCVLGPLFYTGLTTWACVNPRTVVTMTIPTILLFFVFYVILTKDQNHKQTEKQHQGAVYTALDATSDPTTHDESDAELSQEPEPKPGHKCFTREQFATAQAIYPYISFLFVVYCTEYLANQAVITTIAFENSRFDSRDHYQYYALSYNIGKFLGRSHILITVCACPSMFPYIRIKKTWILASIELAHLMFFVFCSWYRFVPHVAIIIILCATDGFISGSVYVNSACTIDDLVPETREKEFGLGLLTVGAPAGALIGGLMGVYVEPRLEQHCLRDLNLGQLCLTRYPTERGWTNAKICT